MAYPVDSTYTYISSSTSITGTLPIHAENDLLLFYACKDATAGTWVTPTGYTLVVEGANGGVKHVLYQKVATASETAPTASSGNSNEHASQMVSIRDINTGSPVDTSNNSSATSNQLISTAITTSFDDELIFYFSCIDANRDTRLDSAQILEIAKFDSGVATLSAYTFQTSAGTSDTMTI